MEHFARRGYEEARAEEIAAEACVSKGAVFGYFETKAGLFLAAYQAAARSFPAYLDAPAGVRAEGFFAILRYWIGRTPHLIHEDWIPYRVTLIGNYCTGLSCAARSPSSWRARTRTGRGRSSGSASSAVRCARTSTRG